MFILFSPKKQLSKIVVVGSIWIGHSPSIVQPYDPVLIVAVGMETATPFLSK